MFYLFSFVFSSFEMYEKEVASGELCWGVVHTEKFWRENFLKFEREAFKTIRYWIFIMLHLL